MRDCRLQILPSARGDRQPQIGNVPASQESRVSLLFRLSKLLPCGSDHFAIDRDDNSAIISASRGISGRKLPASRLADFCRKSSYNYRDRPRERGRRGGGEGFNRDLAYGIGAAISELSFNIGPSSVFVIGR